MAFRAVDSPLPLTPIAFEVLLALADGDLHGYAILRAVESRIRSWLPLRTGTLYRALAALLDHELLAERPGRRGSRRRVYRLTPQGRDVLRAEAARLDDQVRAARAKRVLSKGAS